MVIPLSCEIENYMNQQKIKTRSGITLVELLVVFAILGILIGVIIPVVRLSSGESKVNLGVSSAEVFVSGAIRDGQTRNGSALFFETHTSDLSRCNRLLKGRKRNNYRGEDETSYVIRGSNATFGGTEFLTFWFYNANPRKLAPLEKFKIQGYDGWFVIHRAIQLDRSGTGVGSRAGVDFGRAMSVVLCTPDGSNLRFNTSGGGTAFTPFALEHRNYFDSGSGVNLYSKSSIPEGDNLDFEDFANMEEKDRPNFWPPTIPLSYFRTNGINVTSSDFPKFQNGLPVGYLKFEVTQKPTINENEIFDFNESVSLFVDSSGVAGSNASQKHPNANFMQVGNALASLFDPNNERVNPDSPFRGNFFPRIDFDSNGNIERVFAPSFEGYQYFQNLFIGLHNFAKNTDAYMEFETDPSKDSNSIPKLVPFSPNGPLFFLVGEEGSTGRANGVVSPGDYWLMISPTSSNVSSELAEILVNPSGPTNGGDINASRFRALQY